MSKEPEVVRQAHKTRRQAVLLGGQQARVPADWCCQQAAVRGSAAWQWLEAEERRTKHELCEVTMAEPSSVKN